MRYCVCFIFVHAAFMRIKLMMMMNTSNRVPASPGKSGKMNLVQKSPGNLSARSWNLLGNDADADAKICASAHLSSIQ